MDNIARLLRKIVRFPRKVIFEARYARQRVVRGFSDRDWWSIDMFLAQVLAEALPKYVKDGHGVSGYYIKGETDEDFEAAVAVRDAEYLKYADIFKRFSENGVWEKEEDAKEFDAASGAEMKEALEWLAAHFTQLWD
jgi:hypothetical protein